ncbi:hypothetical protein ACQPXT_40605 [Streptomyces sp. CA-100214]
MLRAFTSENGPGMPGEGVARALLSDSYKLMDNFDMLRPRWTASSRPDTPPRSRVRPHRPAQCTCASSPNRRRPARTRLRGYRSPFDGRSGDELPMISAGFVITNSEVGAGAYTITPRAVIQVCRNGLTQSKGRHAPFTWEASRTRAWCPCPVGPSARRWN